MGMFLTKNTIADYGKWLEIAQNEGAAALIDKERNWTSFDVVAKLRKLTKIKKVGHAGTLDPLATGLLLVFFGKSTKSIQEYQVREKKYTSVIKFGAVTKTYDAEAEEEFIKSTDYLTEELINENLQYFRGTILQKPPMYSAKKIKGRKLYDLARKNQIVELSPVEINIYYLNLLEFANPFAKIDIECSKGTYIRSLANDLGEKLGYGAYLYDLRRMGIGEFFVENALKIDEIIEVSKNYFNTDEN